MITADAETTFIWVTIAIVVLAIARIVFPRVKWAWIDKQMRASVMEFIDSGLIALVLVFFVIRPLVVQAFFIPSGSMKPTLVESDRILVNKFLYRLREPKHHDIVVFRAPQEASPEPKDFIKRLIGLPGDRIYVKDGIVYINDKPQNEPYEMEKPYYDFPTEFDKPTFGASILHVKGVDQVEVPPRHLFVMGDNRNDSNDSHRWGYLPRENLLGKAMAIFWPLTRLRLLK